MTTSQATPAGSLQTRLLASGSRPDSFKRRLYGITAAVILVSGGLVAAALYFLRAQTIEAAERLNVSFAQVIQEQTGQTFQTIDQTLQLATVHLLQLQEVNALNERSAHKVLVEALSAIPYATVIWVTDAQGRVVYDSVGAQTGYDLSGSTFFSHLKDHPSEHFYIGNSDKSRKTGKWVIPVARSLYKADGTFNGAIGASVNPQYFDALWKSIDLGADGSVALFRSNGTLMMRSPFDESAIGKSFRDRPVFEQLIPQAAHGQYRSSSAIDGTERLFAYQTLNPQKGLIVLVGQSMDAVLGGWRNLVALVLAIWAVALTASFVLVAALSRTWERRIGTETQLRQSEENLAITLQSIGDAVIATDASGRITRMNPTAERMTGWTLVDALGHPLTEVFHIINAKTRELSVNPVEQVMANGQVVGLANHTALIARDGREYQIFDSAAPIRNPAGHIVGVVLVFSDVTEDYQLRQSLAQSTEMLERTGEMAKVGGWEYDLRTGVTFWSLQTCRMLELEPPVAPVTTTQRLSLFGPGGETTIMSAAKAAMAQGIPWDLDLPMVTAKGRHFWARVQGFALVVEGKPVKVSGTFQDISERKQAEAALRESEARFRSSFDGAGIGMSVSSLQGQFLQVNRRLCEIVGYPREDLLRMTFQEVTHPDDLEDDISHVRALLNGDFQYFHLEKRYIHRNGSIIWINLTVSLVRDAEGKPLHTVAHMEDITSKKQLEHNLQHNTALLQEAAQHTKAILDNMVDGVLTVDAQGVVQSFNLAASSMFDYPVEQVVGQSVTMLLPPSLHGELGGYLQRLQDSTGAKAGSIRHESEGLRRNGSQFPMSLAVSTIRAGGQTTFIGIVRDISQHRQDIEEIRRLAFFDPLTGLPNRRLLLDRLRQAMVTAARTSQYGALMFLDLDHFKQLNDTLGHDVGDVLLQQVATRLHSCLREGDSVARLGGDEFVVLLENLSEQATEAATLAEVVANKIRDAFGQPFDPKGHPYDSTPSIGIVMFMGDKEAMDDLLKKADVAMYQAKAAGRNTVRFYDPAMQAAVAAHDALEKDMRRGLGQDEFQLHYQIQVDGRGTPTGVEALVRWLHPREGMISPARFIPLAEETGLILPLGQWVLETACAQLAQWAQLPARAAWTIAVNVSAAQFTQPTFVASVAQALAKTGADPQLLKLELTESTLVKDVEAVIAKMNTIKAMGVAFSLDDFGTGYSSLSYLKRLPLDQLKIDQSFVRDVLTDPSDAVIAQTILVLGHSLGLMVIAEGVETAEQRDFLLANGCDAFQGYYFGRPSPAEALV